MILLIILFTLNLNSNLLYINSKISSTDVTKFPKELINLKNLESLYVFNILFVLFVCYYYEYS